MKRTFAVIGGDSRQAELARLLERNGHPVVTFALGLFSDRPLEEAAQADVLVLPLPLSREAGLLNCRESVELEKLWRLLRPEQILCGGQISPEVRASAGAYGLQPEDYFLREELMVANAVPTAEGALQIAMEKLPVTLCGSECLVLGYGRIGRLLAQRLHALGAKVTVAARKYGARAWADAFGWKSLPMDRLSGCLGNIQAVFNTAPSLILDSTLLAELPSDCLCIDLASEPGIDFTAAEQLGLKTVWARGLPGKAAPVTAAAAIRDALYHILEERGEPV